MYMNHNGQNKTKKYIYFQIPMARPLTSCIITDQTFWTHEELLKTKILYMS